MFMIPNNVYVDSQCPIASNLTQTNKVFIVTQPDRIISHALFAGSIVVPHV